MSRETLTLSVSAQRKKHFLIALAKKGDGGTVTVSAKALADLCHDHEKMSTALAARGVEIWHPKHDA
ncbi:MAG: hypothetical protein ACX939_03020 [Hyphococcus sp.]